jgi:hypothetical protein
MSRIAILDIGSTSVGGALVAPEAQIIFSLRRPIVYQAKMDLERFLADVSAAIAEVLTQLVKQGGAPSQVVCVLSAPFYAARTDWVSKKESESFVFTKKLLDELVDKVRKPVAGHEILESSVLDISLNGYELANPYGQRALEVELSHYLSIASTKVLEGLRQAVNKVVHGAEVKFHSFSFALFRVLDELLPSKDYLMLDIGGEISELSLVWHGILRETVSYPLGVFWLTKGLAEKLGTTPTEARSALKLYLDNQARKPAAEGVERALASLKPEWMAAFRAALGEALENSFLPPEIYLLAEPFALSLYQKWFAEEKFESLVLGSTKLAVKTVDHDLIRSLWAQSNLSADPTMLVEIIFYDRILDN